ncbi:tRNA methylthiotransferase YqeV [Clostridium sp. CAG:411]|nr:tRNA methylthiotransferase YqeV [Clostridium sp. CAG:411]
MNDNKGFVAFLTLGCKVNTYETNAMQLLFRQAGYTVVEFADKADIYIVNTCSVTNMADRKSRQMLHKAKKKNPDAIIVAAGCYVQAAKEQLEQDTAVDVVVGNNQKNRIVEIVEAYRQNHQECSFIVDVAKDSAYECMHIEDAGERTRACIKIQDGCNQFCSYCIIPYTRGRVRSRAEEDILAEITNLVKQGYKEFVINGIHLSSYGADEQNKDFVRLAGKPLLHVLERINAIDGVERIRLGSLEPRVITEEFVSKLVQLEKICPHFHLSLQSGCDETLKRMNRKYSTKEFLDGCIILRKYYENPAITTDVIVGFPMETEEEFQQTYQFLERIAFSQMHIFKYSVRKGTRAEKMTPQVGENIKTERSNKLLQLNHRLQKKYEETFLSKEEKVLFEEVTTIEDKEYVIGHNERYLKIAVPATEKEADDFINTIHKVKIENILDTNVLLGKIG